VSEHSVDMRDANYLSKPNQNKTKQEWQKQWVGKGHALVLKSKLCFEKRASKLLCYV